MAKQNPSNGAPEIAKLHFAKKAGVNDADITSRLFMTGHEGTMTDAGGNLYLNWSESDIVPGTPEDIIVKAAAAVKKAETAVTQDTVDEAQDLIELLPDGANKARLDARLRTVQDKVGPYITAIELSGPAVLKQGAASVTVTTAVYSDGTRKPMSSRVAYSSSRPEIVSVDADGKLTAAAAGDSVITDAYRKKTASITVIVPSLPYIAELIEGYMKSGELAGPIAVQLGNTLMQAQHQFDKGRADKAAEQMNKFIEVLHGNKLPDRITDNAITELNRYAQAFAAVYEIADENAH